MTTKSRLAKIEKRLTPQQVVLAYLDEIMRRFSSFSDWTEWAVGNPSEAPLIRVSRAAREAVCNTIKGWPKDPITRGEEDAIRESVFLVKLFLRVTEGLLEKASDYGLRASLCARSLQVLLLEQAMSGAGPETAGSLADDHNPVERRDQEASESPRVGLFCRDRVADLRAQVWQHLGKLYLHEMVISAIRDRYFGGHPILFPAQAQRLAGLIETADALADEYNGFVRAVRAAPVTESGAECQPAPDERNEGALPIDLEAVRKRAAAAVRDEVAFIVRMSKAETLILLGMNEEGCNLAANAYMTRYQRGGQ